MGAMFGLNAPAGGVTTLPGCSALAAGWVVGGGIDAAAAAPKGGAGGSGGAGCCAAALPATPIALAGNPRAGEPDAAAPATPAAELLALPAESSAIDGRGGAGSSLRAPARSTITELALISINLAPSLKRAPTG